jgi:ferredoxin/flavodoxin
MMKKIDLYYYSGTGNTLLVIQEMVKEFEKHFIEVNMHRIEKTDPRTIETGNTIGLAFPVAFQSTFPFIWDFFRAMPRVEGTDIFMVDTMMAFSGAIVGPLKKILKPKGYNCIGAKEIVMPSNWFPKKVNIDKNKSKVQKGLEQAREYTADLVKGKTSWRRIPVFSDLFYLMCCNDYMMKNVNTKPGRKITVDTEKCTNCGLCSRMCPINNITMNSGPVWSDRCETCMRCLSFCPAGAVSIVDKEFVPYKAVGAKALTTEDRKEYSKIS